MEKCRDASLLPCYNLSEDKRLFNLKTGMPIAHNVLKTFFVFCFYVTKSVNVNENEKRPWFKHKAINTVDIVVHIGTYVVFQ
jgi:hypothetical protein